MPTCGKPPSSSGTSRGHLTHPRGAFERIAAPGRSEKPLGAGLSWRSRLGESNPRPTHYEKPGKALRARYLHRLQHRVPECSRRTGCSGLPVHDPVHGIGLSSVTERYVKVRMALTQGHRIAGPPTVYTGPRQTTQACAGKDMCTRITPNICSHSSASAGGFRGAEQPAMAGQVASVAASP